MQPSVLDLKPVLYNDVRKKIRTGMIGLARATSLEGRIIQRETASPYSHATLFGWCGNVLMIGETREHNDARLISASQEIRINPPGCYDVFKLRSPRNYKPEEAWAFMCRAAGARYGWNHILRVFARRTRLGIPLSPIPNSDDPVFPRDCSALVHAALRNSGGPQFKTFDCDVVPGDLAHPAFTQYVGTLFYSAEQIEKFKELQKNILKQDFGLTLAGRIASGMKPATNPPLS